MNLVVVNYTYDPRIDTPEHLLTRYDALADWCRALSRAGLAVRLVQAFSRDAVLREDGIEWIFCEASAPRARWVRGMHDAAAEHSPDLVHVNGFDAPLHTWRLRQALHTSVAICVQDHGGTPPRGRVKAAVRRALMRAADGYLFTSAPQADPWIRDGYITTAAVHEVLEASTSLRPVDRTAARLATGMRGAPALLWVARLHPNKDPLTILDGFEGVLGHLADATLTMIYQDDELLTEVHRRIEASPVLGERVRLVGVVAREELAGWYSAADLFVSGSATEVCGYALLEACACGAVPVVTDIPPFRAITGDGAIGRLWTRGDPRSFSDAVIAVGRRPIEHERSRVLEHFAEHLSWSAVGQRARAIYESVVAGRRSRGRAS